MLRGVILNDLIQKIRELLTSNIINLGYELYDIEYVKENGEYYLRIYIDSPKGISIDDCEIVSNSISDLLDQADYIKEAYFLEVSSSGERKKLKGVIDKNESN